MSFAAAAEQAGLDIDEAAETWRAFGFPDPRDPPLMVSAEQVQTLQILGGMGRSLLGRETAQQLARLIGSGMAQLAEAIVDAFRVRVEIPRQDEGQPYSQVVEDYEEVGRVMLPAVNAVLGEVLIGHLLAVSRASWAVDEERSAVTRDRVIGFADLVDYTRSARALTPAELAAAIDRFESRAREIVTGHGGRVVKLIGDEVMFAVDDPASAAGLASQMVGGEAGSEGPQVRVGLAAGPVVSLQGDYYGEVVNLAARLVKAAEPGTVLASESVASGARVGAEPVDLPQLKGFDEPVRAYRLT